MPINHFPFPFRLQIVTFENNPFQCACLKDAIIWSRKKNIQVNSEMFNGLKPACIVTPVNNCIKNATLANQFGVLDKYADAIASEVLVDEDF